MAPGAVGGKLISGPLQGKIAARLASLILHGEQAGSLPIIESPTEYTFDYAGLQNFGINESLLPAESIIIGQPDTFYTRYKTYLWSGTALLTLQVLIILLLMWNISRRRREAIARQKAVKP